MKISIWLADILQTWNYLKLINCKEIDKIINMVINLFKVVFLLSLQTIVTLSYTEYDQNK